MDRKYLKTAETLDRENRELRAILRRLIDLDPQNPDGTALGTIREEAISTLDRMDGRKQGAGFSRPEVQQKVSAIARAQQAAFLAEIGPMMKEMQASGMSYRGIAEALNGKGIAAPKGGAWAAGSVKFQMDALAKIEAERA